MRSSDRMVFQFPFFNETVFTNPVQFELRLKAFFEELPRVGDYRFAVEIRNKDWLKPRLLDVLRENNVALVLQDQSWMHAPKSCSRNTIRSRQTLHTSAGLATGRELRHS